MPRNQLSVLGFHVSTSMPLTMPVKSDARPASTLRAHNRQERPVFPEHRLDLLLSTDQRKQYQLSAC